jgi:allantoinase
MPGSYPRDMVGYGRTPPHPRWPGDARIAVEFVINYEEGAENAILHGDEASESLLTEFGFAAPRIGQRYLPVESMYEYGSRVGFWRLHRFFSEQGLPVTVFGVAMALERNPDGVAAMLEAGWEIASHGYRWIDHQGMPESEEREHIRKAVEIHERVVGSRPLGHFLGRRSENTVRLVAGDGGFLYSQDSYADELPYWAVVDGKPLLLIPYTADVNDHRFTTAPGFDWGEPFFEYLRDAFDVLYEEGARAPRMMAIGLHCRLVGRPGRFASLKRFVDYVQRHDRVWLCRGVDIARHWQAEFPCDPTTSG